MLDPEISGGGRLSLKVNTTTCGPRTTTSRVFFAERFSLGAYHTISNPTLTAW